MRYVASVAFNRFRIGYYARSDSCVSLVLKEIPITGIMELRCQHCTLVGMAAIAHSPPILGLGTKVLGTFIGSYKASTIMAGLALFVKWFRMGHGADTVVLGAASMAILAANGVESVDRLRVFFVNEVTGKLLPCASMALGAKGLVNLRHFGRRNARLVASSTAGKGRREQQRAEYGQMLYCFSTHADSSFVECLLNIRIPGQMALGADPGSCPVPEIPLDVSPVPWVRIGAAAAMTLHTHIPFGMTCLARLEVSPGFKGMLTDGKCVPLATGAEHLVRFYP
jgi:hypothetical protein